jgi:XTP/dITP diphosphohydrolase
LRLTLIIGTTNRGKLIEIQRGLSGLDLDLIALTDLPNAPEVIEDGLSYRDNAIKKAQTIATWSGQLTLADDSGLEVAALGGQPGVYTARYGGPGLTPRERCLALLERLRDVPDHERQAVFRCVAVLMDAAGRMAVHEGQCAGVIGHRLQGDGGFGYDPIFFLPGQGCSFAALPPEAKDRLSHRAQAVRALRPLLARLCRGEAWAP